MILKINHISFKIYFLKIIYLNVTSNYNVAITPMESETKLSKDVDEESIDDELYHQKIFTQYYV